MKVSELWLREWVNIKLDIKSLSHQITMAGLEVSNTKPVVDKFSGIIIGEIIKCKKHFNNEKLCILLVNIGNNKTLNIIYDSSIYVYGLKVVVATVNSILPRNLKIEDNYYYYNKVSEGILCSFYDLCISNDKTKDIIILPNDAPIGMDIREYLKLEDNIIDINVTSNRADCLSIMGLARDIAAFNNIKINVPKISPVKELINDKLPVNVYTQEACPRYLCRIINNINIKIPTPIWMKEKLRRSGMYVFNTVLDISNFVLLELGQPINIFDKNQIEGGILIRIAKPDEILILMDNRKLNLIDDTVIIADYNKILGIGGVINGKYSIINDNTTNLLVDCAFFNTLSIINNTRKYGFNTEASYRYERGVDPNLQYIAIERVTNLIIDIYGGQAGPVIDITSKDNLPKQVNINLSRNKLDRLIGYHINNTYINNILSNIGCKFIEKDNVWQVTAPSWRFDIKIEEDLIEEIIRIYGYDKIPAKIINSKSNLKKKHKSVISLKRVRLMLNDKGYQEVITYSFVDPKLQQLIHPDRKALSLINPISSEMSDMRLSLWTGLLKTIKHNNNRKQNRVRIFEIGICFIPNKASELGVCQDLILAGAISGNKYEEHWDMKKKCVDFYDMKGDLESILDLTGKLSKTKFLAKEIPLSLHPNQSAVVYLENKKIGSIGVLHPALERKLNLAFRTILFEIKWNEVNKYNFSSNIQEISKFPENRRDIAIIVADNIPASDILTECKRSCLKNQIVSVNLFDVYRGKGVSKGYKSLAISLILQNRNHTFEEKEIDIIITNCLKALKDKFNASLRKL